MTVYLVTSVYLKPLEEVNQAYPGHIAWVTAQYEQGNLLASGRQTPPVGGAMVMIARSEEEVRSRLAEDPFQTLGLAEYSMAAFEATDHPRRSDHFDRFEREWNERHGATS